MRWQVGSHQRQFAFLIPMLIKKYNFFILELKFNNPPRDNTDIALHSARYLVIFSTTVFVRREGIRYLTVLQME